jgi:hypothetical protein
MDNDIETGLISNKKNTNDCMFYFNICLAFCIFVSIILFIVFVVLILKNSYTE